MAISIRVAQLALLSLSALAACSFYTVLIPQGLRDDLFAYADQKLLPGTKTPMDDLVYTGLARVDRYIHSLNYFFWPILHDDDYVRKTRSKMFIGQFMTGWTIVMLESERPGNRGRIASYIIFWGLATQAVGYGLAMPTWMAIILGGAFIANPHPQQVVPDSRASRAIPYSILVGFLVPGILAYLPAPKFWTYEQKMLAMGAWQVFPVWTSIAQQVFKWILPADTAEARTRESSGKDLSSPLRTTYNFILIVAGLIRGGPTWNIFRQLLFPALLDPGVRHEVLASGSATFLEWDETAGQAALVLYAAVQYFMVWKPNKGNDYNFSLAFLPIVWLLTGSSGLAVAFLAARDATVVSRSKKTKKLKQ